MDRWHIAEKDLRAGPGCGPLVLIVVVLVIVALAASGCVLALPHDREKLDFVCKIERRNTSETIKTQP